MESRQPCLQSFFTQFEQYRLTVIQVIIIELRNVRVIDSERIQFRTKVTTNAVKYDTEW